MTCGTLANKNNVAIYAVDPRGLPTSEFDLSQPAVSLEVDRQYLNATMDTLRVLAEQTDGRAIVNRNDLAGGMRQIVRDTSAYYLLGYNSTQAPSDGKFHEIKVRVKRPGIQVRARRGYWALTARTSRAPLLRGWSLPKPWRPRWLRSRVPAAAYNTIRTWIGHVARSERQDQGHAGLGTDAPRAPATATPGARRPPRDGDGGRARRRAVFPRTCSRGGACRAARRPERLRLARA